MRWLFLVVGVCIALCVARVSHAQTRHHADVVYVGNAAASTKLDTVVVELLERLDVDVSSTRRDAFLVRDIFRPPTDVADGLVAWVWLDLRARDKAYLYVVNATRERILIRDVPLRGGLDEVAREQLGHIVEAAIETLVAGGRIGRRFAEVERELAPPSKPPPTPSPLPKSPSKRKRSPPPPPPASLPSEVEEASVRWAIGAQWGVQGFSDDEAVSHGPGIRIEAELFDNVVQLGAAFDAHYRLPIITDGSGLGVRLDTVALRLRPQLGYRIVDSVAVVSGAGIGVDLVHVDMRGGARVISLASDRWTTVPLFQTTVALRARPVSSLWFEIAFVVEHDLLDTRYTGLRGGRRIIVLDPWRVRPGIQVAGLWEF